MNAHTTALKFRSAGLGLLGMLLVPGLPSFSQAHSGTDTLIHLKDALSLATQRYHLLQARQREANAAEKYIDVVTYSKRPVIDFSYQAGLATANNVTGVFLPTGIPPISGPPSEKNNYSPTTGSAAGALLNWQAVTFGERGARMEEAVAASESRKRRYEQEVFGHSVRVISSYLDVLLARELLLIHQRNIERAQTGLRQSVVLAQNGIKAGVDTVLFSVEVARAKTGYLNARKELDVQQLLLGQLLVLATLPIPADSAFLSRLPGDEPPSASVFPHPTIQYLQSQTTLTESAGKVLKHSYLPKLNLWGTAFARGSGFGPDGTVSTWNGMALNRLNYGAGLLLTVPVTKYGEAKRLLTQQHQLILAAKELEEDTRSVLATQSRIAGTSFRHSILAVDQAGNELDAGRSAFEAMQSRYRSGLVSFTELIQTQYSLLKSELGVKQTRWDAWKALLLKAAVNGNIEIFLKEIK